MRELFSGLFGFMVCLLIGILFDQVAIGIIAGLFLGAFLSNKGSTPADNASDAARNEDGPKS